MSFMDDLVACPEFELEMLGWVMTRWGQASAPHVFTADIELQTVWPSKGREVALRVITTDWGMIKRISKPLDGHCTLEQMMVGEEGVLPIWDERSTHAVYC